MAGLGLKPGMGAFLKLCCFRWQIPPCMEPLHGKADMQLCGHSLSAFPSFSTCVAVYDCIQPHISFIQDPFPAAWNYFHAGCSACLRAAVLGLSRGNCRPRALWQERWRLFLLQLIGLLHEACMFSLLSWTPLVTLSVGSWPAWQCRFLPLCLALLFFPCLQANVVMHLINQIILMIMISFYCMSQSLSPSGLTGT